MANIFKKFQKAAKQGIKVAKNPSIKGIAGHIKRTVDLNTEAFSVGHIVFKAIGKTGKLGKKAENIHASVGAAIGDAYTLGGASALKGIGNRLASGEVEEQPIVIPLSSVPESNRSLGSYLPIVLFAGVGLVAAYMLTRKR